MEWNGVDSVLFFSTEDDVNVWDEVEGQNIKYDKNTVDEANPTIVAASVNKLIIQLTSDKNVGMDQ